MATTPAPKPVLNTAPEADPVKQAADALAAAVAAQAASQSDSDTRQPMEQPKPVMPSFPTEGGSYVRAPDGSFVRSDVKAPKDATPSSPAPSAAPAEDQAAAAAAQGKLPEGVKTDGTQDPDGSKKA